MATTINTHGIKIDLDKLTRIASELQDTGPDFYQTIGFDRENGDLHLWEGLNNNWVQWRDPAVITVASTSRHHSAQWIADCIYDAMCEDKYQTEAIGWDYEYSAIWE